MVENFEIFCLYMFHDHEIFPHFLEWAISENVSDCLLFLIEADTIRFECKDYTINNSKMKRIVESYIESECIRDAFKFCSINHSLEVKYDDIRCNLVELLNTSIPLRCIFSTTCDVVWKYIVHLIDKLQYSMYWSNIKRLILDDIFENNTKFELITILNNPVSRYYYEKFTKTNEIILNSMNCWIEVRRIMTTLNLIRLSQSNNSQNINKEALKFASKALLTNNKEAQMVNTYYNEYPYNPFEPLKLLLIELKKIKNNFFDVVITSNDSIKGLNDVSTGLSESIRLEIITLLSMTSSIRLSNIESIEFEFAMSCVNKIEKLLNTIERETFQYLQHIMPQFIESNHFIMMICHTKAFDSTKMIIYNVISTLKFTMQLQNYEYYGINIIVTSSSIYKPVDVSLDSKIQNTLSGKVLIKFDLNDFVYTHNIIPPVLGITALMITTDGRIKFQNVKIWKLSSNSDIIMMPETDNMTTTVLHLLDLCGINDNHNIFNRPYENSLCVSIVIPYSESCRDIYSYFAEIAPNNFEINNSIIISLRMFRKYEDDDFKVGISLMNTKLPYTALNWLRSFADELININHESTSDNIYNLKKVLPKFNLHKECLNDIYYGCQKLQQNQLLNNPSVKYYGLCDISLSHIMKSCSVKVISYILMMLLTGRNVVLISNYSSLLTMILLALPRLSWPFKLAISHYFQTLVSIEAIELWWSTIIYSMTNTTVLPSKYITAIKTDVFMISSMNKWLLASKPLTNLVVIDIDNNEIIYPNNKIYKFGVDAYETLLPPYLNSCNGNLLNMDDSAIRLLESDIGIVLVNQNSEKDHNYSSSSDDENNFTIKLLDEEMLINSNNLIEFSFMKFISSIFLVYLPQSILYYPNDNIAGCNISILIQIIKDSIADDENDFASQLCEDLTKTELFLDLLVRHGIAIHNIVFNKKI